MTANHNLSTIERSRVIAIIRGDFGGRERDIARTIFEAGFTALEVTLNSPRALHTIQQISNEFSATHAIGAGTVLKPEDVDRAAEAGARFIVSPNCQPDVIVRALDLGLLVFPGCFTPSEIVRAADCGAQAVKVFPANCLGPAFVRAIRGPLPDARLIPTGGVTPEAARSYRKAGAWAVGVGSELIGNGDLDGISSRAMLFLQAMAGR